MPLWQSPLLLRSGIADQTLLAKPSGTNSGHRHPMPIVDRSTPRPSCAQAGLPGSVPGLACPRFPSVRSLPREDRRWQRRASIMRAAVVLALLGLFCGSTIMMSEKPQPPPAAPVLPPAAAQAPVRARVKAWLALPTSSLSGMTSGLWLEVPGGTQAGKRLVADSNTDSGVPYARGR